MSGQDSARSVPLGQLSLCCSLNTSCPTEYLVLLWVTHGCFTFWPAFTTTSPGRRFILRRRVRCVFDRSTLIAHFLHSSSPRSSSLAALFAALSRIPNFCGGTRARKGAQRSGSCREALRARSWPRQSAAINLKKGGQAALPLFACTRERLRPRLQFGDRKRRPSDGVHHDFSVASRAWEIRLRNARRKRLKEADFAEWRVIARNFGRMGMSWERNLYLPNLRAMIICVRSKGAPGFWDLSRLREYCVSKKV